MNQAMGRTCASVNSEAAKSPHWLTAHLKSPIPPGNDSRFSPSGERPARPTGPGHMKFRDLGLSDEALRAVDDAGYSQPTPIQEQAIPIILQGRDMFGVAQTGTGKTASFTLPMIDILAAGRPKARMPRSLVLEPTRELAAQVAENFVTYGKYYQLSLALLIGGVSMDEQNRKVDRGVDVLVATPGRLLDHVENGRLLLNGIKFLVVDEGDRLLDMGFMPDVERIVQLTPTLRQTLFFSATMPQDIKRLAKKFLSNPKEIFVAPPASPAETVEQFMVVVKPDMKREVLRNLIRGDNASHALIFCNRKRDIGVLVRSLKRHGLPAAELHGDMAQSLRMETLEGFRAGRIGFLVASDVAARGLDIQGLPHVFNFDVPTHAEAYVHRIGRTGRAGLSGRAITIAMPEDGKYVAAIAALIGHDIPKMDPPGVEKRTLEEAEPGRRRGRGRQAGGRKPRTEGGAAKPDRKTSSDPAREAKPADSKTQRRTRSKPADPDSTREAKPAGSKTPGRTRSKPADSGGGRKLKPRAPTHEADSESELGLGGHVPAFLQRAPGQDRATQSKPSDSSRGRRPRRRTRPPK